MIILYKLDSRLPELYDPRLEHKAYVIASDCNYNEYLMDTDQVTAHEQLLFELKYSDYIIRKQRYLDFYTS